MEEGEADFSYDENEPEDPPSTAFQETSATGPKPNPRPLMQQP
jgi:hypothetical protein